MNSFITSIKEYKWLLIFTLAYLIPFTYSFISSGDGEFIWYALIVIGLNFSPNGQWNNKNIPLEKRENVLKHAIFNQEYWDTSTKLSQEIRKKCEETVEKGREILIKNLSESKIKQ